MQLLYPDKTEALIIPFNKTRIAPTPSGFLHAGNVLSFALTVALAKRANAKVLLRIDDLDKERVQKKYVADIFETLRFLNIQWEEGPGNYDDYESRYSQIHRMDLYRQALQQLRDNKQVFACTCSRSQLQSAPANACTCMDKRLLLDAPGTSWRLITDKAQPITVKTLYGEVIAAVLPPSMQAFIVKKKDGLPAYQLTSLIDDVHFNIDMIVRGNDLWHSTLAQQYLALVLGKPTFQNTIFYHHPLLIDSNSGGKLSKSAGAASIRYLRRQGRKPEEVFSLISNMLGLPVPVSNAEELLDYVSLNYKLPVPDSPG